MDIKQELLAIVATLPAIGSVSYAAPFEANINDTIQFPYLNILAVESGALEMNPVSGNYRETWNVFCYLCTNAKIDNTTAELEDLLTVNVKPLLREFLDAINKSQKFNQVLRMDMKTQHFKYAFIVTGVMAYFTLTERVGGRLC